MGVGDRVVGVDGSDCDSPTGMQYVSQLNKAPRGGLQMTCAKRAWATNLGTVEYKNYTLEWGTE